MMKTFLNRAKGFFADYIPAVKRGRQIEKARKQVEKMVHISEEFTPDEFKAIFGDNVNYTKITDAVKNYKTPFVAELYINPLRPEIRGAIMNMGSRSAYANLNGTQYEISGAINEAVTKVTHKPFCF